MAGQGRLLKYTEMHRAINADASDIITPYPRTKSEKARIHRPMRKQKTLVNFNNRIKLHGKFTKQEQKTFQADNIKRIKSYPVCIIHLRKGKSE